MTAARQCIPTSPFADGLRMITSSLPRPPASPLRDALITAGRLYDYMYIESCVRNKKTHARRALCSLPSHTALPDGCSAAQRIAVAPATALFIIRQMDARSLECASAPELHAVQAIMCVVTTGDGVAGQRRCDPSQCAWAAAVCNRPTAADHQPVDMDSG